MFRAKANYMVYPLNALKKQVLTALFCITTILQTGWPIGLQPESQLPQLRAILQSAAENAPELLEEEFLRKEAGQRLLQAKADYYPSLDLSADLGYRKDFRESGAENTNSFGLTYSARLTRPLYHWGAIEARIEQARIDDDIEALNYLENTQEIYRALRSDYLSILLNESALEAENLRKTSLEKEIERLKIEYDAGNISEFSYKAKELDLKSSLLILDQLERDQQRIVQNFKNNAGWETPLDLSSYVPAHDPAALAAWLEAEETNRSRYWTEQSIDIQIVRNEIEDQEEELTIIKARQRPLLNFSASASQNQSNTSTRNNVDTLSLFAGFDVEWNVFDGFRTKYQLIEAKLKKRRLEAKLDRITIDLLNDQSRMLNEIKFKAQQTDVLNSRLELEQRDFENSKRNSEQGRLSENQLRQAEIKLAETKLAAMTARAELLMHLSDYNDLTVPADSLKQ